MSAQETLNSWFQPLTALNGVGHKQSDRLKELIGGDQLIDLISHLPHRWVDRACVPDFASTTENEVQTVKGVVQNFTPAPRGSKVQRIRLADDTGFLTLVFFNSNAGYLQRQFPVGKTVFVSGAIEDFHGQRQITHPDYVASEDKAHTIPLVEPVYPLQAGLTNRRLHGLICQALEMVMEPAEWLEAELLKRESWHSLMSCLQGLHRPKELNEDSFQACRQRLAYDETLARALVFEGIKQSQAQYNAQKLSMPDNGVTSFLNALPYPATGAQQRAFDDITSDSARGSPMMRMIQGDVGAGKTTIAAFALYLAVKSGYQAAIMAPTEVLARQLCRAVSDILAPFGMSIVCLTGRDKGKKRQELTSQISSGQADIICGTHALFQEGVEFDRLAMVVIDEQHRFGVSDRGKLLAKTDGAHLLLMSATPIPRSLNMTLNGNIDLSILDEKPPGRQEIDTRILPTDRLDDVYGGVRRALRSGDRVFWVCPRVDDEGDAISVIGRHAILSDLFGDKVSLVHGRMKAEEKEKALEAFRLGETSILVATTVIEVGVDVPEATIMIVEGAEQFGLAQLHQLRGRVGRGSKPSFCLLLYQTPLGPTAKTRLSTLRDSNDGFYIAEMDFKLRGPGDLLGSAQSGLPEFRFLNLASDQRLLEMASVHARYIFERGQHDDAKFRILEHLFGPEMKERPQA